MLEIGDGWIVRVVVLAGCRELDQESKNIRETRDFEKDDREEYDNPQSCGCNLRRVDNIKPEREDTVHECWKEKEHPERRQEGINWDCSPWIQNYLKLQGTSE